MRHKNPEPSIQLSIVVPESEYRRLQVLAAKEDRSLASYVRLAIRTRTEAQA